MSERNEIEMKNVLYLFRGVSGSGKSTAARELKLDHHYEADMWFDRFNGGKFDPTKLKVAHKWCQAKAIAALCEGADVVVANTFVRKWEMEAYLKAADDLGVRVEVRIFDGGYRNVHGVPEEKVRQMRGRFEF